MYLCIINNQINDIIVYDPDIRFGKPTIKGTRITVGDILLWLSMGCPIQIILEDYPILTEKDIRAALLFAANREEYTKIVAA